MWVMISWKTCSKRWAWQDEMSKTRRFQRLDNVGIVFTLMTSSCRLPISKMGQDKMDSQDKQPPNPKNRIKNRHRRAANAGKFPLHPQSSEETSQKATLFLATAIHPYLVALVPAKRQPMQTHFIVEVQNQEKIIHKLFIM